VAQGNARYVQNQAEQRAALDIADKLPKPTQPDIDPAPPAAPPANIMVNGYCPPAGKEPGKVVIFGKNDDLAFYDDVTGKPQSGQVMNLNIVTGHGNAHGDGAGLMYEPGSNIGSGHQDVGIPIGVLKSKLQKADLTPDLPLYLRSCQVGNSYYPQRLAEALGRDVIASTTDVGVFGINADESMLNGVYMLYSPGKEPVPVGDTYSVENGIGRFTWTQRDPGVDDMARGAPRRTD
jgi:hypothetical protein